MIKHQAFSVVHPVGTFMAILAWNPENYTDATSILRERFGSIAKFGDLDERDIAEWPAESGYPIILVTAE